MLTRLLGRDSENASLHESFGRALMQLGQPVQGVAHVNRALALAQSANASPRTIDSIRQLLDQAVEQAQADSAAAQNVEASPGLALRP